VHVHLQKVPALFGQLAWWQAQRRSRQIGLIEYKDTGPASSDGSALPLRAWCKQAMTTVLVPLAIGWQRLVRDRWSRLWSAAQLRAATGQPLHPSNVLLGPVDVQGTGRVCFGRGALVYPGVLLETQGDGCIDIGDGVVLSRGVHIVAFERVTLGAGTLVGEYASLRDANHRIDTLSMRHSGHTHAPITIGRNVWIGRGVTVLKGVSLGDSCVVGANAVVTRSVPAQALVAGAPARPMTPRQPIPPADAAAPAPALAPLSP
jgi:acetyltransferase-like isoleucine patch superfamily enzyme